MKTGSVIFSYIRILNFGRDTVIRAQQHTITVFNHQQYPNTILGLSCRVPLRVVVVRCMAEVQSFYQLYQTNWLYKL